MKRSNKRVEYFTPFWCVRIRWLGVSDVLMMNCTGSGVKLGQCLKAGEAELEGLSRAALPVDRQVQPVQGVQLVGHRGVQLQLGQQGEVVRGDVRVGAASDVVVYEPLAFERPHHAEDAHVNLGVEDVVDDALRTQKHRQAEEQLQNI